MKSSFLMKKQDLKDFINFIYSQGYSELSRNKYQLINGIIEKSSICIYQSGIVVYEESQNLVKLLLNYFIENQISQPSELEFSINKITSLNLTEKTGHSKSDMISFWLSNKQIEKLLIHYKKFNYTVKKDPTAIDTYKIYKENENSIYISKNNIIRSIETQDFRECVYAIIENCPVDYNSELFVGIESIGQFSLIGPLIVSIVVIDKIQSVELQKLGLRHVKLGRNIEINRYLEDIYSNIIFSNLLKIDPEEFNMHLDDKEILRIITKFVMHALEQMGHSTKVKIYVDNSLKQHIENVDLDDRYVIMIDENSMSTITASILAKSNLNEWKSQMSKEFKISIIRKNLDEIIKLDKKSRLVKLKFLTNNESKSNY